MNAKVCDRCKKVYGQSRSEYREYSVVSYDEIKIDLCNDCQERFSDWIKRERKEIKIETKNIEPRLEEPNDNKVSEDDLENSIQNKMEGTIFDNILGHPEKETQKKKKHISLGKERKLLKGKKQ